MTWALILHGGAKTIDPSGEEANRRGCAAALRAGTEVLARGGSSIDAVEAAVRALENDPTFNAGYGSVLNSKGDVETCAAVMEGRDFNVGAVAVARGIRNPIAAARAMLYKEPVLIAGEGAAEFAAKEGIELCDPRDLIPPEERPEGEKQHDTVGCIALDGEGRFAVGVSTGGVDGKPPGRVGDSPQPGSGYYCDDAIGAVVFSGDGENIARMMLAARVMHILESSTPDLSVEEALVHLERIDGEAGGICLSAKGQLGWAHNSDHFAVAYASSEDPEPKVYLTKKEERNGQGRQGA